MCVTLAVMRCFTRKLSRRTVQTRHATNEITSEFASVSVPCNTIRYCLSPVQCSCIRVSFVRIGRSWVVYSIACLDSNDNCFLHSSTKWNCTYIDTYFCIFLLSLYIHFGVTFLSFTSQAVIFSIGPLMFLYAAKGVQDSLVFCRVIYAAPILLVFRVTAAPPVPRRVVQRLPATYSTHFIRTDELIIQTG